MLSGHNKNTTNTNTQTGTERDIKAHGASTINDPNYSSTSTQSYNPPVRDTNISHTFDADKDRTGLNQPSSTMSGNDNLNRNMNRTDVGSGHTHHGTTGTTGTTGLGTQQPYSEHSTHKHGTQQQYGTTGTGMSNIPGGVKTMNTVESVTRDAQAQIDAQAAEAIRKSRELNAQDHARLQSSIREATASLEEQARQLKAQIDQERLIAEQHVKATQHQKLQDTAKTQAMEEQKILEAAAARKLELEQKSMKLQQEIDEIVRRKTEEMMREKPGNLCFVHQHQDTTVGAQLAGDIGHVLDLKNSGRVTEATMQGDVQYHPVQIQEQRVASTAPNISMQEQTIQGPETHEKKGGFFHALKTAFTGHGHEAPPTTDVPAGTVTSSTSSKQQPMAGNRPYDQQSTWASDADKHMPQQAK